MKYKLALFLLIFSSSCYSGAIRTGFGLGQGDVDLSTEFNDRGNYAGENSVSTSLYLGYIFSNKIVVDLAHSWITDDLVFGANDNVHFDTYEVLFGYRFNFDKFYLEPKLGYAIWNIKLEEGAFLNPGPEYRLEDDGSDVLYSMSTGYKFTDLFGMSISYKHIDFEQSSANSVLLGFDFEF